MKSRRGSYLLETTVLGGAIGLSLLAAMPAFGQTVQNQKAAEADQLAQKKEQALQLDTITISPNIQNQAAIDAVASTSVITQQQLDRIQATTAADIFRSTPGVHASLNGDDPEMLKQVTVIRGPVSNAYGSGGIGGLVAFETKDAGDFLREDETWALSEKLRYESNGNGWMTSTVGAYRLNPNFDVIGNINYRDSDAYKNGDGDVVRWTGERVVSGLGKITIRPADGHEVKLGFQRQKYNDIMTGSSGSTSSILSRYNAETIVSTYTGNYTYKPDDNPFWDLSVNAYYSDTDNDQYQVWPKASIGKTRYYDVSTAGFRAYNSSRFETAAMSHTLTYGVDYYKMRGESDTDNFGNGEQQAYGGVIQWQGDYQKWLELIGALRYDGYRLDGTTKATNVLPSEDVSVDGNRVSPRFSIGVTPWDGVQFYGLYSQGLRWLPP
ncbi:TonB-dependent receptor domain-containing protein [Brucella pituitosa]